MTMLEPLGDKRLPGRFVWSIPLLAILAGHYFVDICAAIVPASLNVIEQRWGMTPRQSAWLMGIGSLSSGLAQPLFAWISDRTNNRLYGGLGLAIAALLVCSIGLAPTAIWVFVFYLVGMMGSGMFHPIAASTIGALNPLRRSQLVTLFFLAGMLGGVTGSAFAPRLLVTENGFAWMKLLIIPAIVVAIVMHRSIREIAHGSSIHPKSDDLRGKPIHNDWLAIGMLYVAAAIRFTVNIGLLFLYARWMEKLALAEYATYDKKALSDVAAPWVGNLNAATMMGMAIGGLLAGMFIPAGKEKWPLVFVPFIFAPAIACFPLVSRDVGYVLAVFAGIGFASMVPVTLAVAQRLLPMRTSLASGLMLGGAWSVAMIGPVMAEWIVRNHGLATGFHAAAILLAVSGCILLPIRNGSIRFSVGK